MKSGVMCPLTLLFFFKVVLIILTPIHFHMNFKISLPISGGKKHIWDFNMDSFEFTDLFVDYCHFNNSKSSINIKIILYSAVAQWSVIYIFLIFKSYWVVKVFYLFFLVCFNHYWKWILKSPTNIFEFSFFFIPF